MIGRVPHVRALELGPLYFFEVEAPYNRCHGVCPVLLFTDVYT